jgi:hypothetical protein
LVQYHRASDTTRLHWSPVVAMVHQPLTANTLPRQNGDEPSHAREWRWPVGLEIKVNSRHPVMRVVALALKQAYSGRFFADLAGADR